MSLDPRLDMQMDTYEEITRLLALHEVEYKPGWRIGTLLHPGGPMLTITVETTDSETGHPALINHNFPCPPLRAIRGQDVRRWILERVIDVERHEAMEIFLVDGAAPYFPEHGPGARSYQIVERDVPYRPPWRQRTGQRGPTFVDADLLPEPPQRR